MCGTHGAGAVEGSATEMSAMGVSDGCETKARCFSAIQNVARRRIGSMILLRVRAAEIGPSRHFAAAQQSVAIGGKADMNHRSCDVRSG